ncbi:hypothetical protein [Serratia sp. JSRIV004]|nr:hypothetical protein [Serratia sp. JSRIV004]UAN58149.1 hypothetical protein KGP21_03435 [Serratia sp. JSRIV004]
MRKKSSQTESVNGKLAGHYHRVFMRNPDIKNFHFGFYLTPVLPEGSHLKRARFLNDKSGQVTHAKRLKSVLGKFNNSYRNCRIGTVITGYSWVLLAERFGEPYVDIMFFVSKADRTVENGGRLADLWMSLANPNRQQRNRKTEPEGKKLLESGAVNFAAVLSYNLALPFLALSRGDHPYLQEFIDADSDQDSDPGSGSDRMPLYATPMRRIRTGGNDPHRHSLLVLPGMRSVGGSEHKRARRKKVIV